MAKQKQKIRRYFTPQGEILGEIFKSHKSMENNIYIKKIIIFHLFTPHTHARRVTRTRV